VKVADRFFINKSIGDVEEMTSKLTSIRDSWQEAFDARSDTWQESDKGEQAQAAIDSLSSALDNLESSKDDLTAVVEQEEA
jgi:hypothetical protein